MSDYLRPPSKSAFALSIAILICRILTYHFRSVIIVVYEMEKSFKLEQTAEILGISKRQLLGFTKLRKNFIPHFRLSRKIILFYLSEVEPWLQQYHRGGDQPKPETRAYPKAVNIPKPAKPGSNGGKRLKSDAEIRAEKVIEDAKAEILKTI